MVRWAAVSCVALVMGMVAPFMSACASASNDKADTIMAPGVTFTDFAALRPPDSPNNWLVAPADFTGVAQKDDTAPVFNVPAGDLARAWRATIQSQPRTRILAASEDGLRIEAEQKSAVFGFVDRISVQVLPVDADRSTFAAYSTSLVGYWDMGANRGRLRDWIAILKGKVGAM